jgi:hypothetical protein
MQSLLTLTAGRWRPVGIAPSWTNADWHRYADQRHPWRVGPRLANYRLAGPEVDGGES